MIKSLGITERTILACWSMLSKRATYKNNRMVVVMFSKMQSLVTRITAGFLLNAILGLLLMVFLLSYHNQAEQQFSNLQNQNLPKLLAISKARFSLAQLQVLAYSRYSLTSEQAEYQTALKAEQESLNSSMSMLSLSLDDSLKKLLRDFSAVMNSETVDWDEARRHLALLADYAEATQQQLDKRASKIEQQTIEQTEQATALLSKASWLTEGFVVILIIAAFIAYLLVKKYIAKPVELFARQIERSATERDLSLTFDDASKTEIGQAAKSLNKLFESFRTLLQTTHLATGELEVSTREMDNVVTRANQQVEKQRHESDELSQTLLVFAQGVEDVSVQASDAEAAAEQGYHQSTVGYQEVESTVQQINALADKVSNVSELILKLQQQSTHISSLVSVIQQIAEQTNLLALNAAIEAARAGDSGRGFAVVADEVRQLATRTQEATEEIQGVIESLSDCMSESTAAMRVTEDTAVDSVKQAQLAGDALTAIKTAIDTILASNKNIAATTLSHRDQMVSVKQRVEELNDLVGLVSEETGKVSQETQVVVRNISALYQQVNSFKGIE